MVRSPLIDKFLSFLPDYWGYMLGLFLAILITIIGGSYIICKKTKFNNKIRKREKQDLKSIALLDRVPQTLNPVQKL